MQLKMPFVNVLHTTFSNAFSWKMQNFWIQIFMFSSRFYFFSGNGLLPRGHQTIALTKNDEEQWPQWIKMAVWTKHLGNALYLFCRKESHLWQSQRDHAWMATLRADFVELHK